MKLSQIRQQAQQVVRQHKTAFSQLVLIHSAITAGVSLLLMLVSWFSQYIAPEGGLSNMETQTLLSTAQTLLQFFSMIAVPFWEAGLIFCALRILKSQKNSISALTEGFRRWGPIVSSLMIQGVIYLITSLACYIACSIFLSILPIPKALYEELNAFLEAPVFPMSTNIRIFFAMFLMFFGASLCALLVPQVYLNRLSAYRIMDDDACGGLLAVLQSRSLMKGNRRKLLLLDLQFWWFYLLELCIGSIACGNLILEVLGISFPINADIAAWLFPIVALLARVALYWWAMPKLSVSYALFYQCVHDDSLKEKEPSQPKPKPWKY